MIIDIIAMIPAPKIYSGKVRDTYQIGDGRLLMIASDRLSAFDVVLPTVIPDKGVILTQLSRFWFSRLRGVVPNHLTGETVEELGWARELTATIRDRSVIVRAAERIPLECVVRGYLAGSGLGEYKERGSIAGHALPAGLSLSDRLPEPIFTPARKNDQGHDENITRALAIDDYGADLVRNLERISLELYEEASSHAAARGVLLADTKFEFGFIDGELNLIDELLTPDSSRFWDASTWAPGKESDSWDKQFVRNWLIASGWDREPPGPVIPDDVVAGTRQRYFDVFNRLTGVPLEKWLAGASMEQPA